MSSGGLEEMPVQLLVATAQTLQPVVVVLEAVLDLEVLPEADASECLSKPVRMLSGESVGEEDSDHHVAASNGLPGAVVVVDLSVVVVAVLELQELLAAH